VGFGWTGPSFRMRSWRARLGSEASRLIAGLVGLVRGSKGIRLAQNVLGFLVGEACASGCTVGPGNVGFRGWIGRGVGVVG